MIPEIELTNYQLYNKHKADYLANPENAIWNAAREAHILLKDVFEQEREATKEFTDSTKYRWQKRNGRDVRSYSSDFAKAYNKRLGNTVNQQLLRSANLIADMWYTCWIDGGKPDLGDIMQKIKNEHKKILKTELKAYKKNQLLEKNLLKARQNKESGSD